MVGWEGERGEEKEKDRKKEMATPKKVRNIGGRVGGGERGREREGQTNRSGHAKDRLI